jgi:hypothetical protein
MRWIGARPLRRAAAVRETSERGYGNQPYEHWDREHDAGGPGVEPLSLQPRWEERHDDSGKPEERRVKGCEPPGEPVGSIAGSEALPSNRHPGDRASQVRRPRAPLARAYRSAWRGGTDRFHGIYRRTGCGIKPCVQYDQIRGCGAVRGTARNALSVVCPGFIRTQIMNSRRNLPQRFGAY